MENFDIETLYASEEEIEQAKQFGEIIVTEDSGIKFTLSYWNEQLYLVGIEEGG